MSAKDDNFVGTTVNAAEMSITNKEKYFKIY